MTKEKWFKELESVNEISFAENEKKAMQKILDNMGKNEAELEKTATDDVEAMIYVMPMTNVLRSDERSQPFARKDLLEGAPQSTDDSWQVPRLVK
jgi:aspartyl/glutamyl-tRNA(Asn/Gln) amidotransferase C subunit